MPTGVNLAPGTQYVLAARHRRRRLYALSALILFFLLAVWLGLRFFQSGLAGKASALDTRVRAVEMEIARLNSDSQRIVLFEKRLATLNTLLDQHVSWEPVLADLERLLPANTTLTFFDGSAATGFLEIQGITPDVDAVAVALASLVEVPGHSSVIKKGRIGGIQRQEEQNPEGQVVGSSYSFSAELTFDPSVLRKK